MTQKLELTWIGKDQRPRLGPRILLEDVQRRYWGTTAAQATQRWPQLSIKKIPKMVKDRCDWGYGDYSLNQPMAAKTAAGPAQDDLFGGDSGDRA